MVHTKRGGNAASCALCHAMLAVDDVSHSKQCTAHTKTVVVLCQNRALDLCLNVHTCVCVYGQPTRTGTQE
jgi:hypothetical protein